MRFDQLGPDSPLHGWSVVLALAGIAMIAWTFWPRRR